MQPQRIKPLLLGLLLPLLLTACARGSKQHTVPPGNGQPQFSKFSAYADRISRSVGEQTFELRSYSGKECTIRISLQQDGSLNNATVEKGDPGLCKAALSAVGRAKIPPAPDEETWQKFRDFPVLFRP